MLSFQSALRCFLLICLLGNVVACDMLDSGKNKYLEEGKRLYKAGDYQKAQIEFDKVIADDPQNTKKRYDLAEELSKLGDIQDAAKQYQAIARQDPKHVLARVKLGELYLLVGNIDEADKMANEAIACDAENIDAMVFRGSVFAAQNNSDAAFVKAEQALQKKPEDAGATLLLASLMAKTGKLDKALTLLQNYTDKHKNNIAARLKLANLYLQNNQAEKTATTLEDMIKIEPKLLEHRKRLAVYLMNNKQVEKAESVLRTAATELADDEQAKLILIDFLASNRSAEVALAELIPMIGQNTENYELRFKLAELQLAQKKTSEAEETLKEIIEQNKQDYVSSKARIKLVRLYMATRRFDQAKIVLNQLLADKPGETGIVALRGELALVENRIADAIADFRSVLAEQPKNIAVLKLLSAAHLINKDKILARENLEKIVELVPGDETVRLDLVNLLLQTGAKEQATQQLNTLFRLNPNSKNGLETVFKIYAAQKQWEQALQIAKQLEKAYPNDAEAYYLSGLAYQASGKYEQSTAYFEQAISKKPQAVEPLGQMVKNYLLSKQPDKALSKLREIVQNQPKNFFAYNLLGEVYSHSNKYAEAVTAYQQAITLKPDWSVPYRNSALSHIMQKDKADAADILRKGINNIDEPMDLMTDLATLLHQDGEHQKVIDVYEEMYKKYPDSLNVLNNLTNYLADYGRSAEALSRAARLAEPLAKTDDPYLLDTVAWIAYKQGDYEKARQLLLKVIALNPDLAVSNYHLGMVYVKQGDTQQAEDYLQKAIAAKEDFNGLAEAKETLKALEKNS